MVRIYLAIIGDLHTCALIGGRARRSVMDAVCVATFVAQAVVLCAAAYLAVGSAPAATTFVMVIVAALRTAATAFAVAGVLVPRTERQVLSWWLALAEMR